MELSHIVTYILILMGKVRDPMMKVSDSTAKVRISMIKVRDHLT